MIERRGVAEEPIPYGADVVIRQGRVSLAGPETANGVAKAPPRFAQERSRRFEKGRFVTVVPFSDWNGRSLQAIADGPIMDPNRIYLPAGKLSESEYQERLDLDFKRAGIDR